MQLAKLTAEQIYCFLTSFMNMADSAHWQNVANLYKFFIVSSFLNKAHLPEHNILEN